MIYISSSSIYGVSIENSIKNLADAGIHNIELSGGVQYSENILVNLKRLRETFSINFLIHNYFPPPRKDFVLNIASHNKELRKQSINFIKSSINLAHEMGIDRYTMHAGYTKNFQPNPEGGYFIADNSQGISREQATRIMLQTLSEIQDYAAERKVKIGVENLFPIDTAPESSLLCAPSDIFQFLDYIAENDNVGFLLDLGHLFISANYFGFDKDDFIKTLDKKYRHKILGIHLSRNDGKSDQHGPLSPDCWQLEAVQKFNLKMIPVTIESRGLEANEVLKQYQMVEYVLERNV